jgi:hypothetical protein
VVLFPSALNLSLQHGSVFGEIEQHTLRSYFIVFPNFFLINLFVILTAWSLFVDGPDIIQPERKLKDFFSYNKWSVLSFYQQ